MCILCKLKKINASPEVMAIVTPFVEAANNMMDVCVEIDQISDVFNDHEEVMQRFSDMMEEEGPTVRIVEVTPRKGESYEDAIKRGMKAAGVDVEGLEKAKFTTDEILKNVTKH